MMLHSWGCLRLNLRNTFACYLIYVMHTQKENQLTKTKKKTGNFNRGECLGSPLTGFDMSVEMNSTFPDRQAANEKTCQTLSG